jgi:serine protease AprX
MQKFLVALALCVTLAFAVVIDTSLETHFKTNKNADVLVYMNDYLDLDNLHYKGQHMRSYTVDERAQLIVDALQLKASVSQKHIQSMLKSRNIDFEVMWNVNGLLVRNVDPSIISILAKDASIEQIALDKKVEVEEIETKSIQKVEPSSQDVVEWNVEWVKATDVWKLGFEGQGVLVGVGDTGFAYKHEALVHAYNGTLNSGATEFNHNYNWADPVGKTKEPRDTQGHGSHCAGTVAGGSHVTRKIGVAPKAKLIHCLALSTIGAQILCKQWWLAPTDLEGLKPNVNRRPHVVSHSYNNWACAPGCTPQYERATKALIESGIVVVNSAGNRGPSCGSINPNSRFPDMLTIGATGARLNTIASFSSKGPTPGNPTLLKPDITAPGQSVTSAAARGGYTAMSGTSMSTPNVAGGVALIMSAVPELRRNIAAVRKVLTESALKQTSSTCAPTGTPNGEYGYGTVNYLKAIEIALEMKRKNML